MPLYRVLARTVQAMHNCEKSGNTEWLERHGDVIDFLVKEHMPSGSGFDNDTRIHTGGSHAEKLVFFTAFHHMDEAGGYDGWTEHKVTVTPSFSGFNIRITGSNRNDIKDYIHECFSHALETETK